MNFSEINYCRKGAQVHFHLAQRIIIFVLKFNEEIKEITAVYLKKVLHLIFWLFVISKLWFYVVRQSLNKRDIKFFLIIST